MQLQPTALATTIGTNIYINVLHCLSSTASYRFFIFNRTLKQLILNNDISCENKLDLAFISKHNNHKEVADELLQLALILINSGFDVTGDSNKLQVKAKKSDEACLYLFPLFFNEQEHLILPFDVPKPIATTFSNWQGLTVLSNSNNELFVPVDTSQIITLGMNTDSPIHLLSAADIEEIYWAQFYRDIQFTTPSSFAQFILERNDTPEYIIDIGCGSGRDSFFFAQSKTYTIGVDRSTIGISYATKYARQQNLHQKLEFLTVDVGDKEQLTIALKAIKEKANNKPIMLYMRFFLHSIPEDIQAQLMKTISSITTEGDILAAEFRTDKDEKKRKVYGAHYRRYQNAQQFSYSLKENYSFNPIFELEDSGLSPYKDEDPILYRVIAKRG